MPELPEGVTMDDVEPIRREVDNSDGFYADPVPYYFVWRNKKTGEIYECDTLRRIHPLKFRT